MIIIRAEARGTVPSGSVSRIDDMKRRENSVAEFCEARRERIDSFEFG